MNNGFNTNPSNCCGDDCCYKFDVEGCAAGVPYIQLTLVTASTSTIKWMNLNTGDLVDTKPPGFVTGSCADVPANDKVCYDMGADTYTVFTVNAVRTVFKNGVLLTAVADIDAANAVIATATYENVVDCSPLQDAMVCYKKTETIPGTPAIPGNNTLVYSHKEDYNTSQAYPYARNLTYNAGTEGAGEYSVRVIDGRLTPALNIGIDPAYAEYAVLPTPRLIWQMDATGMTPGGLGFIAADVKERSLAKPAELRFDAVDITTGALLGTKTITATGTFTRHDVNFSVPASGNVRFNVYALRNGGVSANDPLLDDTKIGINGIPDTPAVPETTEEVEYSAITQNGVTKYFGPDGAELTGAALTDLLADIASGEAAVGCCTQCLPETVPPDNSTCYEKTVTTVIPGTPGTPGSDTFAIQSGFTTKRNLDGSGTLQERVWNMTYVTGAEADAQYSLRDGANSRTGSPGAWAVAMNPPLSSTPAVPYIVYSQKLLGTPGQVYSVGYWARERSANPAANFRVDVKDGASVIATGTSGAMSTSYTNYRSGTFTMPASGEITMELYQTVRGNAAGNDPLVDDIGLWTTTAAIPGTPETTVTDTVTYRKSTLNGVDTYYDEEGNVVTGTELTTLLADIAAGEYEVVPCATCGCTTADIFPVGEEGQVWTQLANGEFGWADPSVQAVLDNQVLTGGTGTNVTVTMTPVTVTDESGGSQVNYTVTASAKIDGVTIIEDPTTKVLSAADQTLNVLTTVQPTPTATGNTTNLNTTFKDANGTTWIVDKNGDAVSTCCAAFKEQNRFYADPNGADANTGANEAPFLTAQAAVTALGQGDTAVLNEGTYAAVTMSLQNTTLAGASGAYGSLTQIAGVTVSTASGTSNRISDLTVTGNVARTGNAPLYLNNTTVSGNVTLAGTAYTEIRDSSIQDGSITVSGASTLLIEDSKIGSSTFSTAGSVIAMRNVTIDAGDTVTIGAGVIYNLNDVTGNVVIDPAAINAEQALISAGLSATQAEGAVTSNFMHIRMHNADVELNPTHFVTRDPVTGELEITPIPASCCPETTYGTAAPTVAGVTEGDTYYVTPLGTAADAANATVQYRWDGTQWVKTPVPAPAAAAPVHVTEVQAATAAQTTFTLTDTPIGAVIVTRNGVDISDSITWVGNVGTYDSADNLGCVFDEDDKVRFHFETAA